ncbi:SRPBCC family protein [Pseudonocardia adelaidensis]|uniref:Coenzyme Q-binding protein COQ10 START domain-containing protein n=1 Tax=Pseudonocardia adelaidensis TaxID=648754 RepID=A0ABP9NK21_9PSEU
MAESTTDKVAGGSVKDALPTDALRDAGTRLLGLLVQRAAEAATERVTDLSDRLTGVAENGGRGLREALNPDGGRRADDEDDGESRGGLLSRGFSALKEKAQSVFGGGGGGDGGKKLKVTVISEDQDIGLPLRTTYDLWTQLADFPSFMKKVESVEQESDEKTNWKAQVLWSHRTWEATIVEQVPDSHIVWRSKGAKGHVDGAVTFTALGPNLTRVLLVLEYYPQGLFERTGNIWRAQGRRARLEFQHFRRHAMSHALTRQDEVEGWRGEIRDSEVVLTNEEALEDEQQGREQEEPREEAAAEGPEDEAAEDEYAEENGYADEEDQPEDEYAEDDYPEDEYADEDADEDYYEAADEESEPEAEEDREPVTASRARRGGNG